MGKMHQSPGDLTPIYINDGVLSFFPPPNFRFLHHEKSPPPHFFFHVEAYQVILEIFRENNFTKIWQ